VGQALTAALGAALLGLAACEDLPAHTLRLTPVAPPDVDPEVGFGGRVRVEGRTDAARAVFHVELFQGQRAVLRRELGTLPLALPGVLTVTADLAAQPASLTVELAPPDGPPASFTAELPPEFPARGGGLSSPVLLLEQRLAPDDAPVALFGLRRGGRITFTGPEGPFAADEIVLRVMLEPERDGG
jgi:hypothetical protein